MNENKQTNKQKKALKKKIIEVGSYNTGSSLAFSAPFHFK